MSCPHLHRQDAGDGFADFRAVNAVERQGKLRFHQAIGDAGVVALALGDDGTSIFVGLLAQVFLGGGELEFRLFRAGCF